MPWVKPTKPSSKKKRGPSIGQLVAFQIFLTLAVLGAIFGRPRGFDTPYDEKNLVMLHEEHSPYHLIAVLQDKSEYTDAEGNTRKRPVFEIARYLRFNNLNESAVYLKNPDYRTPGFRSHTTYTNHLHLGLLFTERAPKRVLFVGGGGGVGPREFRRDYPDCRVDVVEIDPAVVRLARKYFGFNPGEVHARGRVQDFVAEHAALSEEEREKVVAPPDSKLRIWVMDGRQFMRKKNLGFETYDVIVLDAYTSGGRVPWHLMTREFFELVRARLTPEGVVVSNIITAVRESAHGARGTWGEAGLYYAVERTLGELFPAIYAFPKVPDSTEANNVILVATQTDAGLTSRRLAERARRLVREGVAVSRGFRHCAEQFRPKPPEAPEGLLLTDDYAPVDMLKHH